MSDTPRTTSWTPEQKARIDDFVIRTADEACKRIETITPALIALDKRPKQVWSSEQPDVFMPYVEQGILEDLIAELQRRV